MAAIAVSRLVNPPNAPFVLTEAQVWQGLGIKARSPTQFVPQIEKCEVLVDQGSHVERTVTFRDGPSVKETVDEYAQTAAYFEMETGTRVLNVLSYNETHELVLTFSFVNGIPGLKPGSSRPHGAELEQLVNKIGDGAVQATIDRIRELVRNGTIAV